MRIQMEYRVVLSDISYFHVYIYIDIIYLGKVPI